MADLSPGIISSDVSSVRAGRSSEGGDPAARPSLCPSVHPSVFQLQIFQTAFFFGFFSRRCQFISHVSQEGQPALGACWNPLIPPPDRSDVSMSASETDSLEQNKVSSSEATWNAAQF